LFRSALGHKVQLSITLKVALPTITMTNMRILPTLLLFLAFTATQAQEKSETGHLLNWTGNIQVAPDSLQAGKFKLAAFAIPILEADPGKVMNLWESDCARKGGKVNGSEPAKSTPLIVEELDPSPVTMMATFSKDKQLGGTRMLLAYATNDSTAFAASDRGQVAARALALRLNRAVVSEQIEDQQKLVDKRSGKLEDAQADQAKAEKRVNNAYEDLEKSKKAKSKLSGKQAQLQSDQLHAQDRFERSQDPKDLQKLTKIQQKLVKVQQALAKQMKKEADALKDANNRQEDVPDAIKDQQERQAAKEKANSDLEALKRKLEAIR